MSKPWLSVYYGCKMHLPTDRSRKASFPYFDNITRRSPHRDLLGRPVNFARLPCIHCAVHSFSSQKPLQADAGDPVAPRAHSVCAHVRFYLPAYFCLICSLLSIAADVARSITRPEQAIYRCAAQESMLTTIEGRSRDPHRNFTPSPSIDSTYPL
ncbi:uncharacterized protein SCHCODRAFT_02619387 [Schizophyllum commune H4-8]|uniref:uncharacterized protein n=1 Tax=Schizophyllum commune (strain H4-8 / FGSC 9210) TaxID=578458 RepID=UPI0021606A87|nr:uncharacterized protein SCHCODRAFT_02619387 [Schizophyllum commune H4-8]KAI5895429.1 hypothetical protein SCHCODRAFT_02619387 [Schizophyllum commune H4-8]